MNILPKKKWHVRTKENVARVRRGGSLPKNSIIWIFKDEAKAAVEEKARAERVTLAEHEDRLQRMKSRHRTADSTISSVADIFSSSDNVSSLEQQLEQPNSSSQSVTQHVNLFAELEQQERKNLAVGNKEYEAEKKKEKDDWESKMGNFRAT